MVGGAVITGSSWLVHHPARCTFIVLLPGEVAP